MRIYNCQEVAKILNTTPEIVFDMMVGKYIGPDTSKPSILLFPSIILKKPVLMQRIVNTGKQLPEYVENDYGRGCIYEVIEEELCGLFDIDGFNLIWGRDGRAKVTFGGKSRVQISQGEYIYTVKGPLSVHKDDLIVTGLALEQFREITGSTITFPHEDAEHEQLECQAVFDAENFIERCLAAGKTPDEITVLLVEKHGTSRGKYYGLIARRLYNYPESTSNGTWRKRGERDYLRAKKNLQQ